MNIELLSLTEAIDTFNPLVAIGLATIYFFVEILDSGLTFSITQHKSLKSAGMTFLLYLVLAIEVTAFVTNYLYTLPVAIGAALGSYYSVEYEKKKRPLKN